MHVLTRIIPTPAWNFSGECYCSVLRKFETLFLCTLMSRDSGLPDTG